MVVENAPAFKETRTIAGGCGPYTDGIGSTATFGSPQGPSFRIPQGTSLPGGVVFLADGSFNRIRAVTVAEGFDQVVSSVAGGGSTGGTGAGSADGFGSAATFNVPSGVVVAGNILYVGDQIGAGPGKGLIRVVTLDSADSTLPGTVATFVGGGNFPNIDGAGSDATFGFINGIAWDGGTVLYVADPGYSTIRMVIIPTTSVSTLAGKTSIRGFANGDGSDAMFSSPVGVSTNDGSVM